jgi:predicted DNA-binding transcriptional regulator AlpA
MQTKVLSAPQEEKLLRIQQVVELTTLSKSCINLWVSQGRFIKPISLSATIKVWRLSDVMDWIQSQGKNGQSTADEGTDRMSPGSIKGDSK